MAMRETVRSLRAFFVVSALLSAGVNIRGLLAGANGIGAISAVIGLGFAAAFLYAGIRLPHLLRTAPGQLTGLLIVAAAFLLISFAYDLVAGYGGGWLFLIVGLLIVWYRLVKVRRLAGESQAAVTSTTARPKNA